MSSSLATFPYPDGNHQFNVIDSFVTSWVTPRFSHQPCYLSFYYQTDQDQLDPWIRVFNSSAPLNGSKSVSLHSLPANGTGQMNLDYVDPNGAFERVLGTVFSVVADPVTRNATTWSQSPGTTTSLQQTAASTEISTLSITVPSIQTPSATASAFSSRTSQPSVNDKASASSPAVFSSIVLGSALALLIIALVIILWFRKRRKRRNNASIMSGKSSNELQPYWPSFASEVDASAVPSEHSNGNGRSNLAPAGRAELSTTRWHAGANMSQ